MSTGEGWEKIRMLFLDHTQVKYCKLQENSQDIPGIIYNGSVFTRAKSFPKEELQAAIKECREEYLDHEERSKIPTLLVQGKTSVGIWMKSDRHKASNATLTSSTESTSKAETNLNRLSVRQLASEMRSPTGVEIKTRRYKIKLYQRCFVGSEAVDWLVNRTKLSRPDAIKIGQKMVDKGLFAHVSDNHPFKDEYLFYRFTDDQGKSLWNSNI